MSRNVRFWLLSPILIPLAAVVLIAWAVGEGGNRVLDELMRD